MLAVFFVGPCRVRQHARQRWPRCLTARARDRTSRIPARSGSGGRHARRRRQSQQERQGKKDPRRGSRRQPPAQRLFRDLASQRRGTVLSLARSVARVPSNLARASTSILWAAVAPARRSVARAPAPAPAPGRVRPGRPCAPPPTGPRCAPGGPRCSASRRSASARAPSTRRTRSSRTRRYGFHSHLVRMRASSKNSPSMTNTVLSMSSSCCSAACGTPPWSGATSRRQRSVVTVATGPGG
jgi:hypothetical protein